MKVFISWSGSPSKEIALAIHDWLSNVSQGTKPWMSDTDILAGTKWNNEISKELEASEIGLICVTRSNAEAPWILFEAGALSKTVDQVASKVVPILIDFEANSDLGGPLTAFNNVMADKEGMFKVLNTINDSTPADVRRSEKQLETAFNMWWPGLEQKIALAKAEAPQAEESDAPVLSEKDKIDEILSILRSSPGPEEIANRVVRSIGPSILPPTRSSRRGLQASRPDDSDPNGAVNWQREINLQILSILNVEVDTHEVVVSWQDAGRIQILLPLAVSPAMRSAVRQYAASYGLKVEFSPSEGETERAESAERLNWLIADAQARQEAAD